MAEQETQDWIGAYLELCALISENIPAIKHIDLWYDQLSYEEEEYPLPETCLFMEFNMDKIETTGLKVQDLMSAVTFIFAFDTLADTYNKSVNQSVALEFGKIMRDLHALLQAKSGTNFSSMNRTRIGKQTAPQHVIAYAQTYDTIIRDQSAMTVTKEVNLEEMALTAQVEQGAPPEPPSLAMYEINM